MTSDLKLGDRVECVYPIGAVSKGCRGTVVDATDRIDMYGMYRVRWDSGSPEYWVRPDWVKALGVLDLMAEAAGMTSR